MGFFLWLVGVGRSDVYRCSTYYIVGLDVVCTFFILSDTLVGGNWGNVSNAGLWYWNVNEASSNAWTTVGARLLIKNIINIRDMVCRALLLRLLFSLVGGSFVLLSAVGLWSWSFEGDSSLAGLVLGARPLIVGIWCVRHRF